MADTEELPCSVPMQDQQQYIGTVDKFMECPDCGKRVRCKTFPKHLLAHTEEKEKDHKCPECEKKFNRPYFLKKHMMIHTGEKPHECPECGQRFSQRANMRKHYMSHTGEKPFPCPQCGQRFSQQSHVKTHMLIHTRPETEMEQIHDCPVCGKKVTSIGMKAHLRSHEGEKPYTCDICNRCFMYPSKLKLHLDIHAGEKNYKCSVCGKCFTQKSTLKTHSLVHSGEKNYKCFDCGKCFSQKSTLKTHSLVHSGEKNHKCFECGKCFSQSSTLKTHSLVHTGEKNHKCQECGKCFTQSGSLKNHMAIHAREKERLKDGGLPLPSHWMEHTEKTSENKQTQSTSNAMTKQSCDKKSNGSTDSETTGNITAMWFSLIRENDSPIPPSEMDVSGITSKDDEDRRSDSPEDELSRTFPEEEKESRRSTFQEDESLEVFEDDKSTGRLFQNDCQTVRNAPKDSPTRGILPDDKSHLMPDHMPLEPLDDRTEFASSSEATRKLASMLFTLVQANSKNIIPDPDLVFNAETAPKDELTPLPVDYLQDKSSEHVIAYSLKSETSNLPSSQ